jgi:hypothetical protein
MSSDDNLGFIRCLKCRGRLLPSGVEVHRYACSNCGQEYLAVLQFVPVDPIQRVEGLLGAGDANGRETSGGGGEIP